MNTEQTRITIFEDNADLRYSLKTLLNSVPGYIVCGDYESCDDAASVVNHEQPDVVIMDIDMPGKNGIDGLHIIKEARPHVYIIMHTVFEDEDKLFECLCSGANGYILKNTSFTSLLEGIDNVLHGGAPLSPPVARKVLQSFTNSRPVKVRHDLTERETGILTYLVKGYSYKMIANACFISVDTVRGHIRNIYAKLHVNCGREAVAKALRDKIVKD